VSLGRLIDAIKAAPSKVDEFLGSLPQSRLFAERDHDRVLELKWANERGIGRYGASGSLKTPNKIGEGVSCPPLVL
jgi:hypothetical protein